MLNDTDSWPVTCAECGNVFHEEIGKLTRTFSVTCTRCGEDLAFHNAAFLNLLDQARRNVGGLAGGATLTARKA
jgi:hypothetical protein